MGLKRQSVSFYEQKKINRRDSEKFAKAQDVPVTMPKGMTEYTMTLIVENNTFESNRVIARTVEYCEMLYITQ